MAQSQMSNYENIITQLLAESFAQENQFNEKTLEELEQFLEDSRPQFTDNPSFTKCMEAYCLLLLELEQNNESEFPSKKLGAYLKSQVLPLPQKNSQIFASGGAREYIEVADLLHKISATHSEIPKIHWMRFQSLAVLSALELEFCDRLRAPLQNFWPNREVAIRALLDLNSKKVELLASLKAWLDELSGQFPTLSLEGKLTQSAIVASLRYLMSTPRLEKYRPSLFEVALILLFFGQELTTKQLKNHLGLHGITAQTLFEIFLRLCRLHWSWQRVTSGQSEFEEIHFKRLQEDRERLAEILGQIHFVSTVDAVQKVA